MPRSRSVNVSGLIDRLEARGLVERRPDPKDRRIKGIALTSAGARLRQRLFARLYSAPRLITELPQRDQRCLRDVLAHILAASTE